jgi:hypothetical protein
MDFSARFPTGSFGGILTLCWRVGDDAAERPVLSAPSRVGRTSGPWRRASLSVVAAGKSARSPRQ